MVNMGPKVKKADNPLIVNLLQSFLIRGGDEGTRTPDLLHAKQALFQLSYIPTCFNYGGLCPDVKHI